MEGFGSEAISGTTAALLTELMLLENRGWELWGLAAARLVPMVPMAPKADPEAAGRGAEAGGAGACDGADTMARSGKPAALRHVL
jgi:hypothetical protein